MVVRIDVKTAREWQEDEGWIDVEEAVPDTNRPVIGLLRPNRYGQKYKLVEIHDDGKWYVAYKGDVALYGDLYYWRELPQEPRAYVKFVGGRERGDAGTAGTVGNGGTGENERDAENGVTAGDH